MPTPTYTPLANLTLGSAASSVTFGSIPATYKDLICVVVATGSVTLSGRVRLNGDSTANYAYQRLTGTGSVATALSESSQNLGVLSILARASTTSALQMNINIIDYSATDKRKTIISRADEAAGATEAFSNSWGNTAAVTSVQIFTNTGNWAAGSTFALYGVIA